MERKVIIRLKARIIELTRKIYVIDEILKVRNESRIRSDRKNLADMLKVNNLLISFLAPGLELGYFNNCTSDFLKWEVFNNSNGTKRLVLNGLIYKDLVTKTEAMTIMENLK